MKPLVECVPNFSEGRDAGIVEAIAASIAAVDGVHLAGMEMDGDHNRSVITFMGVPEDVARGAFEACRTARDLIDLRHHRGVHPRIGATDVIPFITLSDCTMDDCVSLARDCGGEIGRSLGIPVYFYGQAALNAQRSALPVLRRGGFERLSGEMESDDDLAPDAGPGTVHASAGATAVGVRDILVAYNVNLDTDDVRVARRIAQEVRENNGGLPGVRALGLLLPERHLAQVSMNLTDYRQTDMAQAYDAVARLAEAEGVEVLESELVGLAPRDALGGAAPGDLRMAPLDPSRFLEYHTRLFA
ncbi:MAG: glutamate formimidoyltransferase [Gemmatimonadetes bacterium]|nr:glutamate formimidoyltransferase [Gemmatimonadota bacterium]MYH17568.1 glutamate formimidoyltransferase [Gemmatimonadota bacterium]